MRGSTSVNSFAASWFAQFISSSAGRGLRIVAGLAIIALGLFVVGGLPGYAVAAIGLVPLLAGATDNCILSPIFGGPLRGSEIRACRR